MLRKVETVNVMLWGKHIGAVSLSNDFKNGIFQYDPGFLKSGLDIAPIHMGLSESIKSKQVFSFPRLNKKSFYGLPGLFADSLPDKFGQRIFDVWLSRHGRDIRNINPIERLSYIGKRGMGALEFSPAYDRTLDDVVPVEVNKLVSVAQSLMSESIELSKKITEDEDFNAIVDVLRVGTSAGGARPKAILAINDKGNILSGQGTMPEGDGYNQWIIKLDGVNDIELGEPQDYGRVEHAYYLMAQTAGINMMPSRLYEENGRTHFLTQRFDRIRNEKLHVQTLCGLAHFDFNSAGAYSYEQAFSIMHKLGLTKAETIQQYRRMLFNVLARNQDDHTKNISFLMNKKGQWSLSPAYDVTYSHNPGGKWTKQHQMSINGKRDDFTLNDLIAVGQSVDIVNPIDVIQEVHDAVEKWPEFCDQASLSEKRGSEIS